MKNNKNFKSKFQKGISLLHQFENSLCYSMECDCGDRECGAVIEIELDADCQLILLHFYKDVYFDCWKYSDPGFKNYIKRILYRIKKSLVLLFTGQIKLSSDFIIKDIDSINTFIKALQEGRNYCLKANTKSKEVSKS